MDGLSQPLQLDAQICARQHGVPVQLVLAIIKIKSRGNAHAWLPGPVHPTDAGNPEAAGLVSRWGPMLVLGEDARTLGFTESFPRLCDSYLGVEFGCRWLAHLREIYHAEHGWHGVVAAYDTGKLRAAGGGGWATQALVNAVQRLSGFEGVEA